jgi:hypothetical protein
MATTIQYIIQDPPSEDSLSAYVFRTSDTTQLLASIIPEVNAKDVHKETWTTDVATAIIPYTIEPLKKITNHPNIISFEGFSHLSSETADVSQAGRFANHTIWEDMNAGSLSYILPSTSSLPPFDDKEKWDVLAAQNPNRFSLPEGLCWHVLRSISRALLWLHYGVKEAEDVPGEWDRPDVDFMPVLIMNVSPEQIWFKHPVGDEHYGVCKLGGFQYARVSGVVKGIEAPAGRCEEMEGRKKYFWAPVRSPSPPSAKSQY